MFKPTHVFAGLILCTKGETDGLEACTKVEFHPSVSVDDVMKVQEVFYKIHPKETPIFIPIEMSEEVRSKWLNYSQQLSLL